MSVDDFTGRKSPGSEAESATPKGKDPPAPSCSGRGARGQLAIATVMWPVEMQSTNRTGLTRVLTLSLLSTHRCRSLHARYWAMEAALCVAEAVWKKAWALASAA